MRLQQVRLVLIDPDSGFAAVSGRQAETAGYTHQSITLPSPQ